MKTFALLFLCVLFGVALLPYFVARGPSLPAGTQLRSAAFPFVEGELLIDRTFFNPERGVVEREAVIFDAILSEIAAAETYLVVDFFLWNPWTGALESPSDLRLLADELADALIAARKERPEMPMLVITDPVNRIYGHSMPDFFRRMGEAGVPLVFTDVARMPDSNRFYSPQVRFWGQFFRPDTGPDAKGRLKNPFDADGADITMSQILRLLHFKANHRKVLIAGRGSEPDRLLITSLNPADGSANHSNIGALVSGAVAGFAARSEVAIAEWSGAEAENRPYLDAAALASELKAIDAALARSEAMERRDDGGPTVVYLSEGAIHESLVEIFDVAGAGTRIDAAIFYFSDRRVVAALRGAIRRGADVRLLMDANRDAFGREKVGVPNRPVAAELMRLADEHAVEVRWAATHGEQYHAKVLRIEGGGQSLLLLGSANWTRRNLANLNLEANLLFENAEELNSEFDDYFDSIWTNERGFEESLPYATLAETGWTLAWRTALYRFQEWSGASTF